MRPCHHIRAIAITYIASTWVMSWPSTAKSMPSAWNRTFTASPRTSGAQTCRMTETTVIATGGIAKFVLPMCQREIIYDKDLLVKGLAALYRDNKRK